MNRLVPYKFEVVAVCHVVDENDRIIAEQPVGRSTPDGSLSPITLFSQDALVEWAEGFGDALAKLGEPSPSSKD